MEQAGTGASGSLTGPGCTCSAFLTVVGYYMLPITVIHDQERLLLPAFLQLAVLAGGGFALLNAWLTRRMAAWLRRRDRLR